MSLHGGTGGAPRDWTPVVKWLVAVTAFVAYTGLVLQVDADYRTDLVDRLETCRASYRTLVRESDALAQTTAWLLTVAERAQVEALAADSIIDLPRVQGCLRPRPVLRVTEEGS